MTWVYDRIRYAHVSKEELPAPIADPQCPMCKGYGHPGYMMNASQWVGCHLAIKGRCPDVKVLALAPDAPEVRETDKDETE